MAQWSQRAMLTYGAACGIVGALVVGGVSFHAGYDNGTTSGYMHGMATKAAKDATNTAYEIGTPTPVPTDTPLLADWAQAETLALDIRDVLPKATVRVSGGASCIHPSGCYFYGYAVEITLFGQTVTISSRQDWLQDKPVLLRLAKKQRSSI